MNEMSCLSYQFKSDMEYPNRR